ncbi:MAG: hypothetical protein LBK27_08945 [Treponema sp.]|jgi:hypothetical protein|nr:hypothetical protein [Treponema sp.]
MLYENNIPRPFRARLLIGAAKMLEGYYQHKLVFSIYGDNLNAYPADFLSDYAYACIMVLMPNTSMEIFELAAKNRMLSPRSNGLHASPAKVFKDADVRNTYTYQEVWEIMQSNNNYYLRSRILGSLLPLVSTWNVQTAGLNSGRSLCVIVPDPLISKNNNSIGITIMIEFNVNNQSYDDFLKEKRNTFPIVEQTKRIIGSHEYDIMIFEDMEKYQNMGGARGYCIATRAEYKSKSNSGIEIPLAFNDILEEGLHYYKLSDFFQQDKSRYKHCLFG